MKTETEIEIGQVISKFERSNSFYEVINPVV
jgi:hypothetical protein